MFKPIKNHPENVEISTYWTTGDMSYLRTALGVDHPENQYNWFRKTYPDLNPWFYGIINPLEEEFKDKDRNQLIEEILTLRRQME